MPTKKYQVLAAEEMGFDEAKSRFAWLVDGKIVAIHKVFRPPGPLCKLKWEYELEVEEVESK